MREIEVRRIRGGGKFDFGNLGSVLCIKRRRVRDVREPVNKDCARGGAVGSERRGDVSGRLGKTSGDRRLMIALGGHLGQGGALGSTSFINSATGHFAPRGNAVICAMSFAFTVCANGTGRTRAGGKCSKCSWCGKGRGRKIWIGRLALFKTASYEVVFFEKTFNDSFGGEVGIGGHRVDVLLYGSEVFVHAVEQDDSENVVKFNWSHCGNS